MSPSKIVLFLFLILYDSSAGVSLQKCCLHGEMFYVGSQWGVGFLSILTRKTAFSGRATHLTEIAGRASSELSLALALESPEF